MYYTFIDNIRIAERENRVICVWMERERGGEGEEESHWIEKGREVD